jgi:subtilisin family serine protease
VDTGINAAHLKMMGQKALLDPVRSWVPAGGNAPGPMPPGHGTMVAFDAALMAPDCTLLDRAILSKRSGTTPMMQGYLSDAVASYSRLLDYLPPEDDARPALPSLVINNSWGMYSPQWDFPVGDPENHSDNPDHPFNLVVATLERNGADILFAAGNCGSLCPADRGHGPRPGGIYGANSHPSVPCGAGAKTDGGWIGYSTEGPGRLVGEKPDVACHTHFTGSQVSGDPDAGTSAATPCLAGVIDAIRSKYPPSRVSPAALRDLVRQTASNASSGHNNQLGFGVVSVEQLLNRIIAIYGEA